eukprot:3430629-Rhodomonas_salina.1
MTNLRGSVQAADQTEHRALDLGQACRSGGRRTERIRQGLRVSRRTRVEGCVRALEDGDQHERVDRKRDLLQCCLPVPDFQPVITV